MVQTKNKNRIGIVAMPRISVGGGFARATRDLIAALNAMGKEVYMTTPFHVDMNKIAELYGPIRIQKFFYPGKLARFFSRDDLLGRKLIRSEFRKMAREVDFIIDLDGGVLHNYLPRGFNKDNYIIWRLSCINPETYKLQGVKDPKVLAKILIKKTLKDIIRSRRDVPDGVKIYPLDEWTQRELEQFWHIDKRNMPFCLYPEIKVDEFEPKKKKKQIIIFGRIAPNKSIIESLKIFSYATTEYPEYQVIILGGVTPDSYPYIAQLKELAMNLGVENRVTIIEDPSFETIKKILSESEILIDSQRGVSLTMTALEGMTSGVTVIAQKDGGTYKEILANGKYGYGFYTIEEAVRTLKELIKNPQLMSKLSRKARKRAQFFSPESFKKRLKKILETK